jgi:hypothetical protein
VIQETPKKSSKKQSITVAVLRAHGEFLRLSFLQAQTESYFALTRVPGQPDQHQYLFRRAAFSNVLKSKVCSILAKAADLRINGLQQ